MKHNPIEEYFRIINDKGEYLQTRFGSIESVRWGENPQTLESLHPSGKALERYLIFLRSNGINCWLQRFVIYKENYGDLRAIE